MTSQHNAKAVSTSYARKLASDSATALQVSPLIYPIRPLTQEPRYLMMTSMPEGGGVLSEKLLIVPFDVYVVKPTYLMSP